MKKIYLSVILSVFSIAMMGQNVMHHCGTENYRLNAFAKHPERKDLEQQIEMHTAQYVQSLGTTKRTRATLYKIPVVVHIIHNGEAIGSGANISVNQINSQITVLNKDFRLQNTDSLMPSHVFWTYTDDTEIEFCLARQTPSGVSTTGIDRFDYNQSDYDINDIENIKSQTIWNPDKYLNIWVCTFGGTASTLLGYATPPFSAGTSEDGIVIGTTNFGTTGNVASPYNKGRTATHEIGHYFNLRHIWGDATCGTDQVSDTAPAEEANYNCPTLPHNANSICGSNANGEMFMNYMDYVTDACMKMFTTGQKNRMRAVLNTGGARNSLTTSIGCSWPTALVDIDANATVSVFPNPAKDHFYLKNPNGFTEDLRLEMYNILGQNIGHLITIQKDNIDQYTVHTDELASGTYSVKIWSKNIQQTISISIVK